jgi:hypothetical protein
MEIKERAGNAEYSYMMNETSSGPTLIRTPLIIYMIISMHHVLSVEILKKAKLFKSL